MASLLVRHIDDQLLRDLKRRAASEKLSVQQLVHSLLLSAIGHPSDDHPFDLITVDTGRRRPLRRQEIVGEEERG